MIADVEYLTGKAARLGLMVNVGVPAIVVITAIALRQGGAIPSNGDPPEWLPLLFYIMGAVAVADLAVAYFVRRFLFASNRLAVARNDPAQLEELVSRSLLIIFALGASPMVYGVVVYLLGGDLQQLAFFGILTLLGYRFLRPTADFLQGALGMTESQ